MTQTFTQNVKIHFDSDTNAAKQQIQSLYDNLTKLSNMPITSKQFTGTTTQLQQASQAAMELKVHLQKATNVNTGKLNLKTFTQSLKQSNQTLSYFRQSLTTIGPVGTQAFRQLTQSIVTAEKPLFNFNSAIKSLGTTLLNSAKWQISSMTIHGIMGAAQKATGHIKALNSSLNDIRIVTGQTTEQMDKFAQKANKMAKELSTTTTAYTDAALIFYQQGLDDSAVEERTNTIIKMANVTGEAAEDVSSYMTAVWNNFDNGTKSLEYYSDAMAALGATTASSTKEIAAGLEKFAAIANTVGLSYEYATSALATVVAETRQSADVVGTAFKTIFSRLEGLKLGENLDDGTTLNKYSAALAAVGVNIKDQQGQLKDMDQILDELGSKWQNLSRDQQMALAQTIAGTRQYTQLISLMENYETFKKNVNIASESEGTLQEQANIYADSWEAASKRVQASAETIYESLLDDDFFINLNNGFATFLDSIGLLIDGMGGLKGILPVISSLLFSIFGTQLAGFIDNMSLRIQSLTTSIRNIFRTAENQKLDPYEKLRQEAAAGLTQGYAKTGEVSGKVSQTVVAGVTDVNNSYLASANKLQGIEKEIVTSVISANQELAERALLYAEIADRAEKTAEFTKGRLEKNPNTQRDLYSRQDENGLINFELDSKNAIYIDKILNKEGNQSLNDNIFSEETKLGAGREYIAEPQAVAGLRDTIMQDYMANTEGYYNMSTVFNDSNLSVNESVNELVDNASLGSFDSSKADEIIGKLETVQKKMQEIKKQKGDDFFKQGAEAANQYEKETDDIIKQLQKIRDLEKDIEKLQKGSKKRDDGTEILENETELIKQKNDALKNLGKNTSFKKASDSVTETFEDMETTMEQTRTIGGEIFGESDIQRMDKYATACKNSADAVSNSADASLNFSNQTQTAQKIIDGMANKTTSFGTKMVSFGQTLSTVAMGLNAIKSIGSIWSNEEASTGEKIISTMMSMSMILPMLSKATTLLTSKKVKDLAISKLQEAQSKKEGALSKLEVAWTYAKAAAQAVLNAIKKYGVVVGLAVAAAAVAVIASLASETAATNNQTQALKDKAAAEEEAANRAEESANKVREAYDQLKDSFDAYIEAKDKISELTSGTKEWNEAINETNKKARELLEIYPELSKYASMKDGILIISDEEVQSYLKEKESQATQLENYASLQKLTAKKTSYAADKSEIIDQLKDSYKFDSNGLDVGEIQEKYILSDESGFTLDYNAIISDALRIFQDNQAATSQDLVDALGISEELANELVNNKTAIINNSNSLTNLNRSIDILYTEMAKEALKDNPTVQTSEYKDAFYRLGGDIIEKEKENELKNKGAGHDDYNIARSAGIFGDELLDEGETRIKQYIADRYGIDVSDIKDIEWGETEADMFDSTKDSQKITYTVNGQKYEDELITSKDMANFYAQKTAEEKVDSAVADIDEFLKSEQGENVFEVYGNMSASSLSGEELTQFDEGFDWNQLSANGYIDQEIINDLKESVEASVEASKIARNIIKEEASPYAKTLFDNNTFTNLESKLSEDAFREMVTNVDKISTQFGKEAGQNYLEALNAIPNEELRDRFAEIDVTSENSEEAIKSLAKEFNLSEEDTQNLINSFDDFQVAAVKTAEKIQEVVSSILKSIEKIKLGDTIDQTQYDKYAEIFNDNINDYFIKIADGTYMLTMEANAFKEAAEDATAEWALSTRAAIEEANANEKNYDFLSENYITHLESYVGRDMTEGSSKDVSNFLEAAGIDLNAFGVTRNEEGRIIIDDNAINAVKAAQDVYENANIAIGNLYDSTVELEQQRAKGNITEEDYLNNMLRIATTYGDARDELNEYNNAVKLYGKYSKEARKAQEKLNKAVRQAEIDQAAVDILNATKKLKDLAQGTDDYIKELENQAIAFNKAFGTNIDSTFVEKYQEYINIWAKGGEESEDAGAYLAQVSKANDIAWQDILGNTYNYSNKVSAIINGTSGTIVVDGEADLSSMIQEMLDAGYTANELASVLKALGYTEISFGGDADFGPIPEDTDGLEGWFKSIKANVSTIKAIVPADIPKPNMTNVANKTKKSGSGGGREKKKVEDETERYHEIEREIDRLERQTSRLAEAKDMAFGANKVALINQETEALENELDALEKLNAEIETYYAQDKANIAQFGAEFDEYGNISNYDEIIANAVEQYNSGAWPEEKYEAFKKYLDQYEETLDKWYDNQDSMTAKQREIVENKLEGIQVGIDVNLELSEDSLEYLEYQLSKIEDEAFAAADAIALITEQVDVALKDSQTYQKGLADLEALAAQNMADGIAADQGGWTQDMIDQAREYKSALLETNQQLEEYRKTIEEKVTIALDEMNEKLDEQIGRFDTYGSILGHYTTILGLNGKSIKNASLIIDLGNKTVDNSINKLEATRHKQETLEKSLIDAQAQYQAALNSGDAEAAKYWKETIEDIAMQVEQGKETLLATFEETLKTAADTFAAAVEQTVAVLSASLTKYSSLEIAQDQYDKQKEVVERFLDINTKNYELSKLMRNINAEIDKTDNLAAKTKLRDVLEEINDIQANNAKLTQYDLDMLNAKYQLRLAEIALEEAQNAKSQVRLTQTAGGGWGYVYTADQAQVDQAQQNYEDKLYEMQKLSQDRITELSDYILQNQKEMNDAIANLRAEDFENREAYLAEIDRIREYYLEKDRYLHEQLGIAVENSGQKYSDTIISQIESANSWEEAHQNVANTVNEALDGENGMVSHYENWSTQISNAYEAAGVSEEGFKKKVVEDTKDIIEASDKVGDSIEYMANDYSTYLGNIITAVTQFQKDYSSELSKVITENENIVTSMNNMIAKFSEVATQAQETAKQIQIAASQASSADWGTGGSGENGCYVPTNPPNQEPEGYKYTYKVGATSKYVQQEGKTYLQIDKSTYVLLSDVIEKGRLIFHSAQGATYGTNIELQKYRYQTSTGWHGLVPFDTGGYTGAWGSEGRLAMLHEKELVLNKMDTANLLASVEIVRSIAQSIDAIGQYQRMQELISAYGVTRTEAQTLEQNVHISAEFPNVTDHNEIEEAINNLINYSSQYINRYRD